MEKPQFLVIGILALAIGFFALRFTSDESEDFDSGYGSRGDDYAMTDFGDESYRGSRDGGRYGSRSGGGSAGGGGSRSSRFGALNRGGSGGSGSGRGGSAQAVSGGSRNRGGTFGRSGSRAASGGRSGSAAISANQRDRSGIEGAGGSSRSSDRVERLGAQEARVDEFYEDGTDLPDNAVLDLKSENDVEDQGGQGEGVSEDDEGWLDFTEDAVLQFPNGANGNAGTVSMDIRPNWSGSDPTDNSIFQIREPHKWENRIQMVKNGQFLRFIVTDATGHEADISYRINHWEPGDTHSITASWEDGVTRLWVDGRQVGDNTYPGPLHLKGKTPLHLGSDHPSGSYSGFNGGFRNPKVFSDARGPDDVS